MKINLEERRGRHQRRCAIAVLCFFGAAGLSATCYYFKPSYDDKVYACWQLHNPGPGVDDTCDPAKGFMKKVGGCEYTNTDIPDGECDCDAETYNCEQGAYDFVNAHKQSVTAGTCSASGLGCAGGTYGVEVELTGRKYVREDCP